MNLFRKNSITNKINKSLLFLDQEQKEALLISLDSFSDFNATKLDEKLDEVLKLEERYLEKIQKESPEVIRNIDKNVDISSLLYKEKSDLSELKNQILELQKLSQENI